MRDLVSHRVESSPDRLALVDAATGDRWSYRDLDAAVDDLAGRLVAVGVEPGDHLGLLVETSARSVVLVHAALRLGARLVPLNVRLAPEEVARQAEIADLDALVAEAATEAAARAASVPVIAADDGTDRPALPNAAPAAVEPTPRRLDEPRFMLFTSGTTGAPKAVVLTAGNVLASAAASAARLGVLPDDRWLLCLPVYHMGGLAPIIRSALYGTAVVVREGFDPAGVAADTRAHDVTGISLVPTMLDRVLDAGDLAASVRFVLLGGAPASAELIERCERRGVPVHPTYGMTETASQVATATPSEAFEHAGTAGHPLLFADVTIVDEADEPVPPGEPGEICVAGPTVSPGYYDDPAATAAAFGPRGLRTGDVGIVDDAGRLRVTGRRADRIITGGENVHPSEVVAALRSHPRVRDAAVVGLDDPEWGERVAALVVPTSDADLDAEALDEHCRGHLAAYKRPRTIRFADALPRTASGTVERDAVRERLRG